MTSAIRELVFARELSLHASPAYVRSSRSLTINDDALDRWNSAPLDRPSPSPSLVETFEWHARLAKIQGKVLKRTHVLRSCPKPAQEMWPVVQELKAELDECEFPFSCLGFPTFTDRPPLICRD